MQTSTKIILVVAGVAVLGVGVLLLRRGVAAAPKKPTTTTDKVVTAVSTVIPIGLRIAEMWMDKDDDDDDE